ncbi:MAG TPA: ABC transporter permease [Flavisolibacter sp.]|jgi:putative ABC transport system permease protein|nr:ABC transporter permease [Flavisolibacter sp.]
MFRNYWKVAVRNLIKQAGFSFINIIGLAMGLTACLLIGLFVRDENQYDQNIAEGSQVYRIVDTRTDNQGTHRLSYTPPAFATALQEFPEVAFTSRILRIPSKTLFEAAGKNLYEEKGMAVEADFFSIFPLTFKYGVAAKSLTEPNTVVLTQEMASRFFGNENPVGKTLVMDKQPLKVTGVLEPVNKFHLDLNYLVSMPTVNLPAERMSSWGWQQFYTYVKLKGGSAPGLLESKLQAIVKEKAFPVTKEAGFTYLPYFQPLRDIHLYSADVQFDDSVIKGNITYVKALTIIAVFILLIACFNFINLATAKSIRRAKEVGVRKSIGADRRQLLLQFTSETVLLTLISILVAIGLTLLLLPLENRFTGKAISAGIFANPIFLFLLLLAGLLVGILAGFYPALVLTRFQAVKVLKGSVGESSPGKKNWLRQVLVVIQFSLSALLIVCVLVVYRQVDYLHNKDLGFNKDQILFFPMRGDNMNKNYEAFKNDLLQKPGVQSVSIGYGFPGDMVAGDEIAVPLEGSVKNYPVTQLMVDPDYVRTMGLNVIAGRDFSSSNVSDKDHAFIINETAVKELGYGTPEKALGQPLQWNLWDPKPGDSIKRGQIIGVVKDFNYKSLYETVQPAILQIYPPAYWKVAVKLRASDMQRAITAVTATWNKYSPEYPIQYQFMDENFGHMYEAEDKLKGLLGIFAGVAIFIGCLGLFGLAAYAAERRTKEIGIRKVLGASVGGIAVLLSKEFIRLVLIALVIASPLAFFLMRQWLQDFAYRITIDWTIFLISALVAFAIALFTVSFQAIKAALANPIKNLRTE